MDCNQSGVQTPAKVNRYESRTLPGSLDEVFVSSGPIGWLFVGAMRLDRMQYLHRVVMIDGKTPRD